MSLENQRWTTRKQVPEHDPAVVATVERSKKTSYGGPGYFHSDLSSISFHERRAKEFSDENDLLQKELSTLDLSQTEDRARLEARIERNKTHIGDWETKAVTAFRKSFQRLLESTSRLQVGSQASDERVKYALREFEYMKDSPAIREGLEKAFGKTGNISDKELLLKVMDGNVPTPLLLEMAARHQEKRETQARELQEFYKGAKADFCERVNTAVIEGWLPKEAKLALTRLDAIMVSLSDGLDNVFRNTMGEAGHDGHLRISDKRLGEENKPALRKTFFHEFLHVISGRSLTVSTPQGENEWQIHKVKHSKSGIALSSEYRETSYGNWLNEAITEWLALKLSGYTGDTSQFAFEGSASYPTERRALSGLFNKGLEEKTVTDAFFENITTDIPAQERGRAFAGLVKRINSLSEEKHLFTRMENEFLMGSLHEHLMGAGSFFRYDDQAKGYIRAHPELKIMVFTLTTGHRDTQISRTYCYLAEDIDLGSKIIAADTQLSDARKRLDTALLYHDNRVRLAEQVPAA